MKKCPYCAELIQDEAILCRYCGRSLVDIRLPLAVPVTFAGVPSQVGASVPAPRREPSPWISLLLGFCLLVAIYGVAFVVGTSWSGNGSDLESILGLYQIAVMFVVTLLAVPGLNPDRRGCLRYIGIFVLSVIPIVGWVVLYWAGKGIARALARN